MSLHTTTGERAALMASITKRTTIKNADWLEQQGQPALAAKLRAQTHPLDMILEEWAENNRQSPHLAEAS